MTERFYTITAEGITLALDLAVGHVRSLRIERHGQVLTPLHTAPWVDDPAIADDPNIPPNLKFLSGDFFCAPFGASDVEEAPPHGWPANSPWRPIDHNETGSRKTARFVLEKKVMGARLIKEITLIDGHPFAYQRHTFEGGKGAVSVASHAMTRFAGRGRLAFSSKAFAELPETLQESDPERGQSLFGHPAHFTDLSKLPLADGSSASLHDYPIASGHEDFAMLVEAEGNTLGWAAATRLEIGDMFLSLKNPADYPVTFLWYSNGGRYYAPWNGRHLGVIGIEEGRAYSAYGHAASIAPNPLSEVGIPTSLTLDPSGSVSVRHVIGGAALPGEASDVTSVETTGDALKVTTDTGAVIELPFDASFLAS